MVKYSVEKINALHRFLTPYKKSDGTLKRGAINDAAAHFNVTPKTITRWLKENPQPTEMGVWISESNYRKLAEAISKLKRSDKFLDYAAKEIDQCIILNYMSIKSRRELLGESPEEAFKNVLQSATDNKENNIETNLERLLNNASGEINQAIIAFNNLEGLRTEPH